MPPPPRRPWRGHPGPGMPPPPPGRRFRSRRRGGSCLTSLLAVLILIIIVFCAAPLAYHNTTAVNHHSRQEETAAQIRVTPLPASAVHETAYYTDELGWIRRPSTLERALKDFYSATGVQPHIYLSETYMDQAGADSLYSRLFTDEGHFLLVIANDWSTVYILGDNAAGVLTDNVMDLFWKNFDDCADSARADEDVLADAFTLTADSLLAGASPEADAITDDEQRTAGLFLILAIIVFLVVLVVIITVIVRARKNAHYERSFNSGSTKASGGASDSENGASPSRGYNLNGEFHSYDENQRL